jgi:hypothetical protein
MTFDGETFDPERDGPRLTGQLRAVYEAMSDGEWHSLWSLSGPVNGSDAAISARLRDLRKPKFGGYRVERRYVTNGVWEYRLLPPLPRPPLNRVYDPEATSMTPIKGWKAPETA